MKRGYVTAPWGQIHYYDVGDADETVLLYPNRPRSGTIYRKLADLLAERYRVVIIDPPGHGMSDPLPGEFEVSDLTASAVRLLDELGIDKVRFSGHHTGATIAVDFAANYPERVVAIAPTGFLLLTEEETQGRIDGSLFSPAFGNPPQEDGSHLQAYMKKFPPKPHEDVQFLTEGMIDDLISEPHQVASALAVYRYDWAAPLGKISVPTLFVQSSGPGEPPTLQRSHEIMDRVPGSRLVTIEGGDVHFTQHRAEELSQHLLSFFGEVDA